ncbi:tagatose-bisphosphate aldolase [Carnobacteriaceae bacterium zg-ZUI78]|nr:tagatose-bisphosphate aldolase [Carnobacteriaceae bacterium zg-ZUI78]
MFLTKGKRECLNRLSNKKGILSALAVDQRGALRKMIERHQEEKASVEQIEQFKILVSSQLTAYASSILLDAEYGIKAMRVRHSTAGALLAYEKTGYDANTIGRLPDILDTWSVKRLKEQGADACKFLLYYNIDDVMTINDRKKAYIERIGSECRAEDIPFFLEIVTYDNLIQDNTSIEYARIKPNKVIEAMKEFSQVQYGVDVLKVEVPVNMAFVEGFTQEGVESVYTQEEAKAFFKMQSDSTPLPFIFLSAGVSADLFQKTLVLAKEAESTFNGVLCGRATWSGAIEVFVRYGKEKTIEWLQTIGKKHIETLNFVLNTTATSWTEKFEKGVNE